ncbi:MAG: hypothetical protein Q9168_003554 [Polycauliona sp. 1 TL-2023]
MVPTIGTNTEPSAQDSILDLPQLYTRPSSTSLLLTLARLEIKPATWGDAVAASPYDETNLPRYLTGIIASPLAWIEDDSLREQIWEAASSRLSERSGRSAKRLASLAPHVPALENGGQAVELGAGTGLVGLATAAMYDVHVHLTDLPAIVPNLLANTAANSNNIRNGRTSVGELDWSEIPDHRSEEHEAYDLVIAADPLYSPQHPAWLVAAICHVLKKNAGARVVIELPLREAYAPEIKELQSRMEGLGMVVLVEGTEGGFEDWGDSRRGNERVEVECWWAIWRWASHN